MEKKKRYVRREYESKEVQRNKLKELVGTGVISCRGKMTQGKKVGGNSADGLRLMIDVTVFLKDRRIYLDHLWVKNKSAYYDKYEGKILDFKAEVVTYGLEHKVGLDKVFIKKYDKNFRKKEI